MYFRKYAFLRIGNKNRKKIRHTRCHLHTYKPRINFSVYKYFKLSVIIDFKQTTITSHIGIHISEKYRCGISLLCSIMLVSPRHPNGATKNGYYTIIYLKPYCPIDFIFQQLFPLSIGLALLCLGVIMHLLINHLSIALFHVRLCARSLRHQKNVGGGTGKLRLFVKVFLWIFWFSKTLCVIKLNHFPRHCPFVRSRNAELWCIFVVSLMETVANLDWSVIRDALRVIIRHR